MASNSATVEGDGTPVLSSPRNSSSGAAAANNSLFIQMGCIEVPKVLQDGEKFIKWDEVSLAFKWEGGWGWVEAGPPAGEEEKELECVTMRLIYTVRSLGDEWAVGGGGSW